MGSVGMLAPGDFSRFSLVQLLLKFACICYICTALVAHAQYDTAPFGSEVMPDDFDAGQYASAPIPNAINEQLNREGLAIHSFSPSFVQADRLLATLKAMGYSVVEYEARSGAGIADQILTPNTSDLRPPVIVRIPDARKTSLMDTLDSDGGQSAYTTPSSGGGFGGGRNSSVPDIGGTYLHGVTSGAAQQRLLIVHDPAKPDQLKRLTDLIDTHIDIPAQQIVIEALVIVVDRDELEDFGVSFSGNDGRWSGDFQRDEFGSQLPFVLNFSDISNVMGEFQANLRALISRGQAEVLSNPSVLVLDGRQARIQIGQQIPVSNSTATANFVQQQIEYFPVGIVLNLRPRVSRDHSEVSMQVETIVSSVIQRGSALSANSEVVVAPAIDNRQVQTFVRVADNTPFIIGGLISTERSRSTQGVPILSRIPLIGRLFRREVEQKVKSEVIVVLTPHIVPMNDRSFSRVRPKDSEIFESSDNRLFRDSYRVRSREVFDLGYIRDSQALTNMREVARKIAEMDPARANEPHIATLNAGGIPGEDILVRRMLWETIRNRGYARHVDPAKIVMFRRSEGGEENQFGFLSGLLPEKEDSALVLEYPPEDERDFQQPAAKVQQIAANDMDLDELAARYNREESGEPTWAIVIKSDHGSAISSMDWLRGALVLKWIIDLNESLPQTLDGFYTGRSIVYPTEEDLRHGFHFIDRRTARYWYELQHYYPAFAAEINRAQVELRGGVTENASGADPMTVPRPVNRPGGPRYGR